MPRLIVNADDYGLTPGINAAIEELFAGGWLTSATIMAAAASASDAIQFARANILLGTGCHIVLLDGEPIAPPSEVVSLLRPGSKNFYCTLGEFLRALYLGRIRAEHIEREATAQIVRLQDSGIQLTHVDTHKHTHMFPAVLTPLLGAAKSAGIRAIRNPFEPAWSVAATTAPLSRKAHVKLLRALFAKTFAQSVRESGLMTTDGTLGIAATGTLNPESLNAMLQAMPAGTWELVCHPGHIDAALKNVATRLRESREVECSALQQMALPPTTTLHTYGDLFS